MKIREDRFISPKHALLLKKTGYNDPCFAYYDDEQLILFGELVNEKNDNDTIHVRPKSIFSRKADYSERMVLAPTVSDIKMFLEYKGYKFNYDSRVIGKFVVQDKEIAFYEDDEVSYKIFKTILEQAVEYYCENHVTNEK